jgi:hypothetical protein
MLSLRHYTRQFSLATLSPLFSPAPPRDARQQPPTADIFIFITFSPFSLFSFRRFHFRCRCRLISLSLFAMLTPCRQLPPLLRLRHASCFAIFDRHAIIAAEAAAFAADAYYFSIRRHFRRRHFRYISLSRLAAAAAISADAAFRIDIAMRAAAKMPTAAFNIDVFAGCRWPTLISWQLLLGQAAVAELISHTLPRRCRRADAVMAVFGPPDFRLATIPAATS